jgi:hypothetical protein
VAANIATFKAEYYENEQDAKKDVKNGKIDAAVIIPKQFSRDVMLGKQPKLGLVVDNSDQFVSSSLEGKMSELLDRSKMLVEVSTTNNQEAAEVLKMLAIVKNIRVNENNITIEVNRDEIPVLVNHLVNNKIQILSVQSLHSLEHYFLSLTSSAHVDIIAN